MSKGGTTSGSTEIPAWLESAAIENINKARDVSQIGYVPYYGPDVAAFSPMQQQSMQSTGNAASAFGLAPQGFNAMAGMPQAENFAGGIQGYSSAPLYEQSLDKLFANAPAQYRAMNDMFIDPFTGARPRGGYGATPMQTSQMSSGGGGGGNNGYFDQVHADRMAGMNNGGEHYGVNREYNPYAGNMMTDSSGKQIDSNGDGVVDYRDMSFGEDGRRQIGMGERVGEFLLGGPSKAFDAVGRTFFDISGAGKVSEDPAYLAQQQQLMNDAAARGEAKYAREEFDRIARQNQLGLDYIQRGDMYPPQIQGGLLVNSPYQADGNEQALAQARMQEDIRAAQEAEANAAYVAEQQAKIDQINRLTAPVAKTTVNSNNGGPKGNNDSWKGTNSSGTAKKGFSFGL